MQRESHQNDERLANHAHFEIAPNGPMQLLFRDVEENTPKKKDSCSNRRGPTDACQLSAAKARSLMMELSS